MRLIFNHLMYFMLLKSVCILLKIFTLSVLFEVILCYWYWYFLSWWNQTDILHSKWFLMFMIVSLVPVSDEHRDLFHIPNLTIFRIVWLSYLICCNFQMHVNLICVISTRMKMICHMKKKYYGILFLLSIGCGTSTTRKGVPDTLLMLSLKGPWKNCREGMRYYVSQ